MKFIQLSEVNSQVKVNNGKLFFADMEVRNPEFIREDKIASLYVVRVWCEEQNFYRFVTGLDLIGNKFWLGGVNLKWRQDYKQMSLPQAYFDTFEAIKRILDTMCEDTAGKDWAIFEEEDADVFQDDFKINWGDLDNYEDD